MTSMNKLVWQDYWKSLRWKTAWRRMCELSGIVVVIVQMFTIWPLNILDLEGEARLHYYILAFPLVFTLFSSICVEIKFPKQMYLTPLTQVERREYMEKLLRLKLVIPNLIMGAVITVMLILKKTNIAWGGIMLLQNILSTMGMSLFYKVEKSKNVKELQTEGNLLWAILTMGIGLLGEFFILGAASSNESLDSVALIWFVVSVVVQVFCLCKMYSHKNQYFDNQASYERWYVEEEKKEVKSVW
ncbi:MAG: hypothetical protein E7290_07070 [Lachnospiraceae bacterium]|nr:hypothetical protein [Lachnospiraceae bacterium]